MSNHVFHPPPGSVGIKGRCAQTEEICSVDSGTHSGELFLHEDMHFVLNKSILTHVAKTKVIPVTPSSHFLQKRTTHDLTDRSLLSCFHARSANSINPLQI